MCSSDLGLASVRVLRFSESGKFLVGGGVGGVFVRNVKDQELTRAEATFPGGGRSDYDEVIDRLALDESGGVLFGCGSEEGSPLLLWRIPKLERVGVMRTSSR